MGEKKVITSGRDVILHPRRHLTPESFEASGMGIVSFLPRRHGQVRLDIPGDLLNRH